MNQSFPCSMPAPFVSTQWPARLAVARTKRPRTNRRCVRLEIQRPSESRGEKVGCQSDAKRQSHWRPKAAASGTQIVSSNIKGSHTSTQRRGAWRPRFGGLSAHLWPLSLAGPVQIGNAAVAGRRPYQACQNAEASRPPSA